MPRNLVLILAVGLVLVLPRAASTDMIYLALGDSSAFGETNRTQNPSYGDRGYVAPFADYLATRYGGAPGGREPRHRRRDDEELRHRA